MAKATGYSAIFKLKSFTRLTGLQLRYFTVPAILSLLAASFEGVGIALLLPLVKGILQMDFDFVQETKIMHFIMYNVFHISSKPNTFIFAFLVGTILVAMVASSIMRYFASITTLYQLRIFCDSLRKLIFNRYLSFGKLFFDRNNLGHLHNVLINFTYRISGEFRNLQDAFVRFFSFIIYVVIMSVISLPLTILVVLTLPVLTQSVRWLIEKIKKTSIVFASSSKRINEEIFNILSCIPLVKMYASEKREEKKFSILSGELCKLEFSLDKKSQLIQPINEIIILIIVLLLVSLMSFMAIKEKSAQVSSFLVFFILLKKASSSFHFITIIKKSLATINGPLTDIIKIFDDKDKSFVISGEKEFTGLKKNIVFRNTNFSYTDGVQILKNISFTIDKGKVIALVGPSGAGKTTLINLILRFYDSSPSTMFVDGTDIREFNLESLREHIALVSQDAMLFNDTLKNNLTYGLKREVTEDEIIATARKARLYDFVMRLPNGFDTYIGDRGVKLSGGEKQRVAITRALLKNTEILILDEATSSLDSKTEKLIQEAITEAIRGRTTIVIAHRLSTIKNADKIAVIENGRFMEEGTLSELLDKKGKFFEYWQEQKFYE